MEATVPLLSIAIPLVAVATLAGVSAGVRNARDWGPRGRTVGYALLGLAASLLVFLVRSVSLGASFGGAILAAAVGGMAVLVLVLVRGA